MNTTTPKKSNAPKPIVTMPDMVYDVFAENITKENILGFLPRKINGDLAALALLEIAQAQVSKNLCTCSSDLHQISSYKVLSLVNTNGFFIIPSSAGFFEISNKNNESGVIVDEIIFGIITTLLSFDEMIKAFNQEDEIVNAGFYRNFRNNLTQRLSDVSNFILTQPMDAPPSTEETAQIKSMLETVYSFT